MKNYFILIILLATIGCKKDPYAGINFEAPVFKDSTIVKTTILNDTIYSKSISNITCYKDYIVLFANINDYTFHLLDKKTGSIIKSSGRLGRGPQEMLIPTSYAINPAEGIVTAFHQMTREITVFYLDSILQDRSHFMDKISLKKHKNMTFYKAYPTGNDFLLYGEKSVVYPGGARFCRFSKDAELLETYNQYPLSKNVVTDSIHRGKKWQEHMILQTLSADGKKIIETTRLGCMLEILDISNGIKSTLLKGYYRPNHIINNEQPIIDENTTLGFYSLRASDKYLYALYSSDWDIRPEIQVYDMQGNPIRKYITDTPLSKVCIDEENKKAYAITLLPSHEQALITFDL